MFSHMFKRAERSLGMKAVAGFLFAASIGFALFALYQWLRASVMFSPSAAALISSVVSGLFALLVYFAESHFSDRRYDKFHHIEAEIENLALTFLENLLDRKDTNNASGETDSHAENVSPFPLDPGQSSRV